MTGILHVGIVLVHETPPVAIDQDPRHRDVLAQAVRRVPVGQPLDAHAERIGRIGMPEAVRPVKVPHVPELCAGSLPHAGCRRRC